MFPAYSNCRTGRGPLRRDAPQTRPEKEKTRHAESFLLTVLWGAAAAGAENHPDFFPKRQINDSWRTAELPEKADPEKLSLFQLANEAVEPDRVSKRNNLIPLRPGLKILHRREPGSFSTPIRLERGVKYTFSAPASCTNPGGNRIVISASFMDKNSKVLPSGTAVYLHHSRASALPI